ncbi:unnamed protein product [Ilex paraguariensis]|uniref:Clathrin interactor EPSIN 2 n=1 Tax=Ilex paraguariensis TaxID=185542 RepID=A0ABC8V3L9_9AQUA
MDLLGSLSESFSSNALAIVPTMSASQISEADETANSGIGSTFMATQSTSTISPQPFDDPFGDGPFKAVPSTDSLAVQPPSTASASSLNPTTNKSFEPPQAVAQDFGNTFLAITYMPSDASNVELPSTNPQYVHQDLSTTHQNTDILADILPPSGPSPNMAAQNAFPVPTSQYASHTGFPAQTGQPASQTGFPAQPGQPAPLTGFQPQSVQHASQTSFALQAGQPVSQTGFLAQNGQPPALTGYPGQAGQPASQTGFPVQSGQPTPLVSFPSQMGPVLNTGFPAPSGQSAQPNANFYGGFHPQSGSTAPVSHMAQFPTGPNTANFLSQSGSVALGASPIGFQTPQVRPSTPMASQQALPASTGSLAMVPQPAKDKFETKSTVWADTLSRGLVNLNISGAKTNPLADIGIDFDAINRKEKRMEKPTTAPVTSNVYMGKAMGSGSGIGRAGAGALRAPPNPMMGSGMGIGLGGGPVAGIGMGGYGAVNQPMGVGMRTNMVGGQGVPMQPPTGFPPGSTMPGGYNPMMGPGGYGQQPYGGGYR